MINSSQPEGEKEMTNHLYQIAESIHALLQEDEWTEEVEAALDALQTALPVKVESLAGYVAKLEARAEACRNEEKRIAAIRKGCENRAAWLRAYALRCLKVAERTEVETATRTVKIKKNPPSAVCDNAELTPARFLTVVPESYVPDKAAIKKAISGGEEVAGWHLEQGERIEF
jgi:hypothetical protein